MHCRVEQASCDQDDFQLEHRIFSEMASISREQHKTRDRHAQKTRSRDHASTREHGPAIRCGKPTKQTNADDRDRACENKQKDDVPDISDGISPKRLSDRCGEAGLFERDENSARRARHHRIS